MKKIRKLYPFFKNNRFANYPGERDEAILSRSLYMFIRAIWRRLSYKNQLHTWVENNPIIPRADKKRCIVTWIGHATFLLNVGGVTILTDPVFGNVSTFFKRLVPPGITLEQLPEIDAVVISHNHYDHMDENSLIALKARNPNMQVLVPYGDKQWFVRRGFANVSEYSWWESHDITALLPHAADQATARCTFLPAYHWSQRGVFDRNHTLWGSWMIESEAGTVYFAGDTAYGPHFGNIAHHFPNIDVALMPIAPTEPREWMRSSHILPEEAVEAFLELGASHFVPMHWGTFWFGLEDPICGMRDLCHIWNDNAQRLSERSINLLRFGQSCYIEPSRDVMLYATERIHTTSTLV